MSASRAGTSRLVPVTIEGPAGGLEGLLQEREGLDATALTALLCHPHPLYGGTMHNKVVHRAAATLLDLGARVLRFNFRGVGKSDGSHDRGEGELEDARAALRWLERRHPDARRWVLGFSFGSWVAARLAASEATAERMILIAPPVHTSSFVELHTSRVPKLVIQGTADEICKRHRLEAEFPRWSEPKKIHWVEGAGHFFDAKLAQLGEALRSELEGLIRMA